MSKRATSKILIIVTNSDVFEKVGYRTELWLSELVESWDIAEEAGYKMDIASPSSGKIPLDPESLLITEMGDAIGPQRESFQALREMVPLSKEMFL